jgi:tRNA1(Val) A37 N6-methylase TrmN6
MQILLSLCKKNTLNRIARCPTYPVRVITKDLEERLQSFYDSASCDCYEISNLLAILFESAAGKKCRKLSGQYFTPRQVARKVISMLKLKQGETIIDPGCGTGIFPLEILRNLANSDRNVDCESLIYLGVENDPILALSTAISLDWAKAPVNWRVLYANFLYVGRSDVNKVFGRDITVNAIIANPPYVRHHLLGERKSITAKLSTRWGSKSLSLRSGLHSLFLAHSAELLDRGRMVFIMPMEMITSNYGSALLEPLQRTFNLEDLVMYYEPKSNSWNTENLHQFSLEKHSELKQAWTLAYFQHIANPVGKRLSTEKRKPEEKAIPSLKDIAAIHRGISTGANEFFVLTDVKVRAMGLSGTDFVKMVVPTKIRKDELPSIFTTEDWSRLKEKGKPCWLLSLPYENLNRLPQSIREYIRKGEKDGIHLIATCKNRYPWYDIKADQHHISDFVFTYMSRGYPKFVYNKAHAYNLTNLLGVHLNATIKISEQKMTNLVQQLNIDLKKWIDQEGVGRKYLGGLVKFEPGDLKNMPIYDQSLMKGLGIVSLVSRF